MANAIKHKQRSSRANQTKTVPVNMFVNNAMKKAEARYKVLQARINLNNNEE